MLPQWIIEKKRDGQVLSREEIQFFFDGYVDGSIPPYQMSALAMAIYFQGMTFEETSVLTDVMMRSGDLVDTSSIKVPKVDKHSTGGIGDKVSLILAPLVASTGLAVPMISGRGLGITGGTLDKLESIPGYRCDLSEQEFLNVVQTCGCSISGQTSRLAPADRKLYALRDVTGTVASIPLIVASILCKKLAEGIDALILDVKAGKGTFMKTEEQAEELARTMVQVGSQMGKSVQALLTNMDQPLGRCVGNALEVEESLAVLSGEGPEDLVELTLALSSRLLLMTQRARTAEEAQTTLREKLHSGAALDTFLRMISLQGGKVDVLKDPKRLSAAPVKIEIRTKKAGFIEEVDAEAIGKACSLLGAGRTKVDDTIDHTVGISDLVKQGEEVEEGQTIAVLHASEEEKSSQAKRLIENAIRVSKEEIRHPPLLYRLIDF